MRVKNDMRTALCLDSSKAWMIEFANEQERIVQIESGVEIEFAASTVVSAVQEGEEAHDDMELRKRLRPLRGFIDEVIDAIGTTDSLVVEGAPQIVKALMERLTERDLEKEMEIHRRAVPMTSFAEFRLRAKSYYS